MARRFEPRYVVDARVLEMLVCPLTKTRLTLSADHDELISVAARLAFPIRLGVPMLSIDEAREIDPEELQRISALAALAAANPGSGEPPAEA